VTLRAFFDELECLEKTAFMGPVGKFFAKLPGEAATATERLLNPVKGIREGWKELSGTFRANQFSDAEKAKAIASGKQHLFQPSVPLREAVKSPSGRVRGVSEELSRRGWTGEGKLTKYLPVGQKGLGVGLGAGIGIPEVYKSYKAGPVGPTGEGGVAESGLGELLGTSAFIGAGRLRIVPGMAMYGLASGLGRKSGRIVDRLRSGASLRQAISAPSPTEAQDQLANITENYSHGNA
jgi:hypothetical protein